MSEKKADIYSETNEPIHLWFGLTYSSYLVLRRSLMEAMPLDWQRRMVACLREMQDEFFDDQIDGYWVRAQRGGKFVSDPLSNYRRPDRELIESLRRKPSQPGGAE